VPRPEPHGPALVTGGEGFVAGHLAAHLEEQGIPASAPGRRELDLLDGPAVARRIAELEPSRIFHLAAFSSPQRSVSQPREVVVSNVEMTINLLEAVREGAPGATVVFASSGQVYGALGALPLTEDSPLDPLNPYAVSKAACDLLAGQYAGAHELEIVRLRPFNHAGPGQSDEFVVSALARQVAEAEAGGQEGVLRTGNTESVRDFTDVRDIARAYLAAAGAGRGVFNACSDNRVSVGNMVEHLQALARVPIRHEIEPARVRPNEVSEVRGSSDRLRDATGWQPEIPFSETLRATLDWWRARLS